MMRHFRQLMAAAAAAILTASLAGTPVLAAGSSTQAYIDANNRALVSCYGHPQLYNEDINIYYGQHRPTSLERGGTVYADKGRTQVDPHLGFYTEDYIWTYDAAGNLAHTDGSLGDAGSFAYDASGYVLAAANADTDGTLTQTSLTYTYNEAGQITGMTSTSSEWINTFTYDQYGRISDMNGTTQDGHTSNNHYTYKNNRLVKAVYTNDGAVTLQRNYTYNSAKQLTKVTGSDGTEFTYTYNADGSLASCHEYYAIAPQEEGDAVTYADEYYNYSY